MAWICVCYNGSRAAAIAECEAEPHGFGGVWDKTLKVFAKPLVNWDVQFPFVQAVLFFQSILSCLPQERTLLHNGVKGMKSPCGVVGRRPTVFGGIGGKAPKVLRSCGLNQ